jgi:hypothetical protein
MELTYAQKHSLYENGFVKLPGIVPKPLVDDALRHINASLGSQGMHPDALTKFRSQSYCPELVASPAITGLLHQSPLWSIAETTIGPGQIHPVTTGQIALRFPSLSEPRQPGPHLDGMYTPANGVKEGVIQNFTALIGVFLSAVPHDFMGNFTVWPGTHRSFESYFREHGPQTLLQGMPQVAMPNPVQVTVEAGDAFLCHYQLAHGIAGNSSPHIRYAIFFRLWHIDHDTIHWECMTDIWREWAGMQEVIAERQVK